MLLKILKWIPPSISNNKYRAQSPTPAHELKRNMPRQQMDEGMTVGASLALVRHPVGSGQNFFYALFRFICDGHRIDTFRPSTIRLMHPLV